MRRSFLLLPRGRTGGSRSVQAGEIVANRSRACLRFLRRLGWRTQSHDIVMVSPMSVWRSKHTRRRNPEEIEALVMDAIAAADCPLSAYDIADIATRAGSPIIPNQVYRTLARLIDQGRVHRLQSPNAYTDRSGTADSCLICDARPDEH